MTIDTHGFNIDIESLKDVAAQTARCNREIYQTISIDLDNGEVLYWCDMAGNWVEYRSPAVFKAINTRRKYSPQALSDALADALRQYRHEREYFGSKCNEYVFSGKK